MLAPILLGVAGAFEGPVIELSKGHRGICSSSKINAHPPAFKTPTPTNPIQCKVSKVRVKVYMCSNLIVIYLYLNTIYDNI